MANLKRLKMLADMLDKHDEIFGVPKIEFDLLDWNQAIECSGDNGATIEINQACGTKACAVGSACYYPPFNKMGLRMVKENNWDETWGLAPDYKGARNWDAVEKFFGLREEDAYALFSQYSYNKGERTPWHVARRVKSYIRKHERKAA
jgi:hypothetical protein